MENWEPVAGFEGLYEISSYGNVLSLGRKTIDRNGNTSVKGKRMLKPRADKDGYGLVTLVDRNGANKGIYVHRLVAKAFVPNPENKQQVNHKNAIKTDNNSSNLEWCTFTENIRHAMANNLRDTKGEKSPRAILTEANVLSIRKAGKYDTYVTIAEEYRVSKTCISDIIKGRTWTHL